MIAITMSTAEMVGAALWTGGGVIALAVFIAIGDRLGLGSMLMDRRVKQQPRPDRRLPVSDYELLGTDWRDRVAPFFHREVERSNRRRLAVISATGMDPEKTAATVKRPAA